MEIGKRLNISFKFILVGRLENLIEWIPTNYFITTVKFVHTSLNIKIFDYIKSNFEQSLSNITYIL